MAANAQIVIELDEKGVVRAFQQINAEGQKLDSGLRKVGSRGNVVMTGLAHDTEKAHDAARLLERTLGVEMPRTLTKIIAQSALLRGVLAAAFRVSVIAAVAQVIATVLVEAIIKVRDWWNRVEDAKNKALELDQQKANKLLVQSIDNIKELRLQASLAGADEVSAVRIKLAADLKDIQSRLDQVKAGDKVTIQTLVTERIERERTANAEIAVIREKQARESAAEQMKADLEAINFWLSEEDKAIAEVKRLRADATAKEREIQDENVQLAIQSLEGEERVNAELTFKIAQLEELKRKYAEFPDVVANATGQEILLQENAVRDIATLRRQQAEQMARDWQMAVQHMARQIESFLDNPIQYLKHLWKRFIAEMVAQWILGQRAMAAATTGQNVASAAGGGGGGFAGFIRQLFGIGGGGSGGVASGSAAGIGGIPFGTLASGVALPTTRPGGFPDLTSLGGLSMLPLSAGGRATMGGVLPAGASLLTRFRGNALSSGQGLLAGGIGMAGMLGGQAIGFGGPGRGALAGGLMGAGLVGAGIAAAWGSAVGSAGAAMGSLLLGPLGIGILAASVLIGLLMGKGKQNKQKAQAMDILNAGRAQWQQVISDYKAFRIPYESAIGGITQIWQQMVQQWSSPGLGKYGGIAIRNNTPEYQAKLREVEQIESERQRRMQIQGGPAMFAQGGYVGASASAFGGSSTGGSSSFGPLGIAMAMPRSPRGFSSLPRFADGGPVPIIAHAGEFVVRREAVKRAGRGAMERLNATGEMSGGGINITIVAWDGASVDTALRNGLAEKIVREIHRAQREGAF